VSWTLRYHIEGALVGHDDEEDLPIFGSRIAWDGKVDSSIQDIVTKQESRTPERETAQDRAADWLEKYPTEHGPTDS
jgi:hypothetical protein